MAGCISPRRDSRYWQDSETNPKRGMSFSKTLFVFVFVFVLPRLVLWLALIFFYNLICREYIHQSEAKYGSFYLAVMTHQVLSMKESKSDNAEGKYYFVFASFICVPILLYLCVVDISFQKAVCFLEGRV